ncbi:hypothetical protein ALC62_08850 [Cyphomyrmex costatus]|uniref:Uncharacterized protein n=1 Tax=Cyphomyrmex costatus TaxID=456900 RepID=A0A195CJW1_9HYME|nr:hypothetical protein ALC62_08850 [Cyphomyrmex costatus]
MSPGIIHATSEEFAWKREKKKNRKGKEGRKVRRATGLQVACACCLPLRTTSSKGNARAQTSLYMSQLQLLAEAEHTALGMAMHAVATVAHHLARRKPASSSSTGIGVLLVLWNTSSGNTSTDDRCLTVTPFFERDRLTRVVDKTKMFRASTEMRNVLIDVRGAFGFGQKSSAERTRSRKTELSAPLYYRCRLPSLNTLASAHDVPPAGCCGRYPVEIIFPKNVTNQSANSDTLFECTQHYAIYIAITFRHGRQFNADRKTSETMKKRRRRKGLANKTACHGDEWGDLARRSQIACVPRRAPWDD